MATATSTELRNTARAERSSDGWRRRVTCPGAHTLTLRQQERRDPERLGHGCPLRRGLAAVGAWNGGDMGRRCGPERRSQSVEQPVMEGREEHFD